MMSWRATRTRGSTWNERRISSAPIGSSVDDQAMTEMTPPAAVALRSSTNPVTAAERDTPVQPPSNPGEARVGS